MEPRKPGKYKKGAAPYINGDRHRMDAAELKSRFAERDQRQAADARTEAQKWLNDPPPDRSALAHYGTAKPR